MDEHRIGQIMKPVTSCLAKERAKEITNHSTRKTVVANLKEASQLLHNIIQVIGHARESSLDQTTESERRQLSRIASEYAAISTLWVTVQGSIAVNYFFLLSRPRRCKYEGKYPSKSAWVRQYASFLHTITICQKWQQNLSNRHLVKCSISVCSTQTTTPSADSSESQRRMKRLIIIDLDSD